MALEILAIVVTPINEVAKYLFGSLKQQICYLTSYNTNIQNLRSQVSELKRTRAGVQTRVEAALRNLEEPFPNVQKWLEDTTEEKLDEQLRDFDEANINKKCFKGLCPDLSSRLMLSKQAVRMTETFHTLQEKGNNFPETGISHPRPPPNVELLRRPTIVANILPRDSLMNDLMEALGDSNIRSIGVHGMGGIGKTTLVEKINNELAGHILFNKVIMVIVSKDPDLMKIQKDIAQRLGLNLPDSSTEIRANRLFERLEAEEKLLIILDDVWKPLKVEDIGLPGGCKLIVTTRYHQEVCVQMKLQKIIKVEPLSKVESWVLFESKAGDVVTLPNLKPIAEKIVEKCKGSPLAITALGSTLTSVKEEFVWSDALNVLSDPTRSGLDGIMPEVVTSLSFSFELLESLEIKKCFLFCCLFPEDYNINLRDLRDYGIGERFLKVGGTLDNASDKLLSFIKKLKDCCLLLEGGKENSVKMHDVVRDVAICIGGDAEYGFLVNVGGGLIKFRESEDLKEKKRISFMKHSKDVLRDPLKCPQLQSLLIRENDDIRIDQESFFEDNKSLEVLDLRETWIIPKSISCLTNLKTLHLVDCDVSDKISLLGGLTKLEILNLSNSIVKTLPEEIGNLVNLRSLDLNGAELSFVAPNVISKLSYLEEFYMHNIQNMENGYTEWDTMTSGGEYNARLKEVELLSRLSRLTICIKGTETIEPNVSWLNNLKQLIIRDANTGSCYNRDPQHQCVELNEVNPLEYWHWFYKLISTSVGLNLELYWCFGIKNVADLVALRDLKQLKELEVYECDDIEYLIGIDESNKDSQDSFNTLKKITLYNLKGMKKIYHGPTPSTGFFGQLRILEVFGCDQIKNIFSANLLLAIKRLEYLYVQYCSSLKEIVGGENEDEVPDDHSCLLPQLKTLELSNLSSLTSFYQGDIPISCPLEKIDVRGCRNLKKFPLAPQTASHLQTFRAPPNWFNALEWADQSHQAIFQPFFETWSEEDDDDTTEENDASIASELSEENDTTEEMVVAQPTQETTTEEPNKKKITNVEPEEPSSPPYKVQEASAEVATKEEVVEKAKVTTEERIVEKMTSDMISQEMAAEPVVEKIKETTTEFSCNPLTISMASAEIIVVLALEIKLSIKVTVLVVKDISQTMCKTMGTRTVH
ncbi:hypothetical protein AQUCO_09300053v1 [Aquilegia coerulea]|uniref:AAA+ ATPase domain-containing protein n=1 Tax=Aquilegia coerulea TaxID=218851 RepID=A0A2G5C5B5_AQUCA|nr:hypothetical protein AQUCO_09300053v1 [Aquilegia coerulea]